MGAANGCLGNMGLCSAILAQQQCLHDHELSMDYSRKTVIIFDWDDTLMCSTAIKEHNIPHPAQLAMLERAVARLLLTAMDMGHTAIVTNASLPWVRSAAQTYMPAVVPLLKRCQVTSARQNYEWVFGNDPRAWKIHAFRDVLTACSTQGSSWFAPRAQEREINLTALGDSMVDIEAAEFAMSGRNSPLKTVKLKELPTIAELLGQLQLVQRDLPHIVEQGSSCSKTLVQGALTGWRISDSDSEAQPFALF